MNKEEFKSLIIRQFKEPQSAIHMLLLDPDIENCQFGDFGHGDAWYTVSEFGLMLHIEPFVNDQGTVGFQVQFVETSVPSLGMNTFGDLSDPKFYATVDYQETIVLDWPHFTFGLKKYAIKQEGYEFRIETFPMEAVLAFDIRMKQVNVLDPEPTFALWRTLRGEPKNVRYTDFVYDDRNGLNVRQKLRLGALSKDYIDCLLSAFESFEYDVAESPMMQIIDSLLELQ